mmetsp:Transcript_3282/g.6156  ORF Transcript_3282/g.6156 Transcript_3282/m.6156 type:complete len:171 (+) Transcript_3282:1379-1891(+)
MIPEAMPDWLVPILRRLYEETKLFPEVPNHVLVNEYKQGEGILAHEDGPMYQPVVAIISLGTSAVIRFTRKSKEQCKHTTDDNNSSEAVSLLLRPRSLLIFQDALYSDFFHSIEEGDVHILDDTIVNREASSLTSQDTSLQRVGVRHSLTCRSVMRVAKVGKAFSRLAMR